MLKTDGARFLRKIHFWLIGQKVGYFGLNPILVLKFLFWIYCPRCCWLITARFLKHHKYDFLYEDKHQSFPQTGSIVLLVITRYLQSTQNSKFAITSMQCLCNISRENWGMKLIFCILIKSYKLIVFFDGFSQVCPKYNLVNLQYLFIILRKNLEMKLGA